MDRTAHLLREIYEHPEITQRGLASAMNVSLGTAHSLLSSALSEGLCVQGDSGLELTPSGAGYLDPFKVDTAVILAAGFGSRFVPLTFDTPKGLLKVFGERMIERQIRQLREAGISRIVIVVGYLKEHFEYLIDKFGCELVFNPEFDTRNNLSSLYCVRDICLSANAYILSSDNWLSHNLYHRYEPGSWYSSVYKEGPTGEWCLALDKKGRITGVTVGGHDSQVMYGPVYLAKEFSQVFMPELIRYYQTPGSENFYWEQPLADWLNGEKGLKPDRLPAIYANCQPDDVVYEFENLEELRAFDESYKKDSDDRTMKLISEVLGLPESEITGMRSIKAGMTNHSFSFDAGGQSYVCRVPGEGTSLLVNRDRECESLNAMKDLDLTDEVIYMDPRSGYKITRFYPDARVADPESISDTRRCLDVLRRVNSAEIETGHIYDVGEELLLYERLCDAHGGVPFEDYPEIRQQALALYDALKKLNRKKVLTHLDANVDNFLFTEGDSKVRLIDWEYSGMCDPLASLNALCIYTFRTREQTDRIIDMYFEPDGKVPTDTDRAVVYGYNALFGLTWALWAVYKLYLGVHFGDYTIKCYRLFKEYAPLAMRILE